MPASTRSKSSRRVICETLAVERVEVNVEPAQTGVVEHCGQSRQQDAIGGQGEVANARRSRQPSRSAPADRAVPAARRR